MVEFLNNWHSFSVFQGIYFVLVASLGIPTNLLSIFVLCFRPCGLSKSTVIYLVSLAVVDTLFLVLGGLVDVIESWLAPPPSIHTSSLCGSITFNEYWTLFSSQWIVTAFMLERYLVLRNGTLRRRFSRPHVALSVVMSTVLVSQVISVPCYWLYESWPGSGAELGQVNNFTQQPTTYHCLFQITPSSKAMVWMHILASGCVPMGLTLSFSVLVSLHFRRKARVFVESSSSAVFRLTQTRLRRSSRIQITVAVTTVCLSLPRYVAYGLLNANRTMGLLEREDPQDALNITANVGLMLQWLSLVIHFCLFCFVSSGFRRESLALLRCQCCQGRGTSHGRDGLRLQEAPRPCRCNPSSFSEAQAPPLPQGTACVVWHVVEAH
ncbi:probable G-protein coupled receptor 139 [Amia ocellicauda]|uniref:probable G-protein coupled receptor 139 n=1 Tax=Amia ocellicauda TaxID=2972642 RepID=UPI003464D77B